MSQVNQINILIIDDDEVDILQTKSAFIKLFEQNPFIFYAAKNGVEAINKLYGKNGEQRLSPIPNAILVDIRMPEMGGINFLKELRNDSTFDTIPVYLLTCLYGTDDKIATQNLNVTGKIVKPMQRNDALSIYMKITTPVLKML